MPYRELILRVKAAKAATGITYKEIEDKTRKIGTPVSESSIKRIFAEGSENKMTRNDKTLMPVASVLLAPEIIKDALQPKKETPEESLDIIAMKDDRIDVLKHQMAAKETEYLEKFLRGEEDFKDQRNMPVPMINPIKGNFPYGNNLSNLGRNNNLENAAINRLQSKSANANVDYIKKSSINACRGSILDG